jgi:membrane-associated phospholipid phosphatase
MKMPTLILLLITGILSSCILTYFLIYTGIDWSLAVFYNQNEFFVLIAAPFVLGGMIVPIIIIVYFLLFWKKTKTQSYYIQLKRSIYSFIYTYVIMTILKVFTNRVDMEPFEPIGSIDTSNQFRFGFMNSNSWWESFSEGWPSGHTMIAVGMAIAIHPLLRSKFWKIMNITYPIIVAWSVSTAFHWLSDVVAGITMGAIVGYYYASIQIKSPSMFLN